MEAERGQYALWYLGGSLCYMLRVKLQGSSSLIGNWVMCNKSKRSDFGTWSNLDKTNCSEVVVIHPLYSLWHSTIYKI